MVAKPAPSSLNFDKAPAKTGTLPPRPTVAGLRPHSVHPGAQVFHDGVGGDVAADAGGVEGFAAAAEPLTGHHQLLHQRPKFALRGVAGDDLVIADARLAQRFLLHRIARGGSLGWLAKSTTVRHIHVNTIACRHSTAISEIDGLISMV